MKSTLLIKPKLMLTKSHWWPKELKGHFHVFALRSYLHRNANKSVLRSGIAAFKTRRVAVSSDGGLIKKRSLTPQQRESMIPFFSSLIVPPVSKKNSWGKLFFKSPSQSVFSQKWTLLQTRRDLGSQGDLADTDRKCRNKI